MIKIYTYLACILLLLSHALSQTVQTSGESTYHPPSGALISTFLLQNLPPRDSRVPDEVSLKVKSVGGLNFIRSFIDVKSAINDSTVQSDSRHAPYQSNIRLYISRLSEVEKQQTLFTLIHYGGKHVDTLSSSALFTPTYDIIYNQERKTVTLDIPIELTSPQTELATDVDINLGKFTTPPNAQQKQAPFEFVIQLQPTIPLTGGKRLVIQREFGYQRFAGDFTSCLINNEPVPTTFTYNTGIIDMDLTDYDFNSNRTLAIRCDDGNIADGGIDFAFFRITYEAHHEGEDKSYHTFALIREKPQKSMFVFVVLIIIASILGLGALIVIFFHKKIACLNPSTEDQLY